MNHRAFIALGSNLQRPREQVLRALEELDALPGTRVVARSSLYRSAPLGYDDQPDFINAVAELRTALAPHELLRRLLALEAAHGRARPFPNAPRVLDLDVLMVDDLVIQDQTLTLPHPRMHERGFVLLPLLEIAPQAHIPGRGRVSELAQACTDQGVERLAA